MCIRMVFEFVTYYPILWLVLVGLVGMGYMFATQVALFGQKIVSRLTSERYKGKSQNSALIREPHDLYHIKVAIFKRPMYCNVCKKLMAGVVEDALTCGVCQLSVHGSCVPRITTDCKPIMVVPSAERAGLDNNLKQESVVLVHQWAEGNHSSQRDICMICGVPCGSLFQIAGYHCVWCQRVIHSQCHEMLKDETCNLGPLNSMIISPTCVRPRPESKCSNEELQVLLRQARVSHSEERKTTFSERVSHRVVKMRSLLNAGRGIVLERTGRDAKGRKLKPNETLLTSFDYHSRLLEACEITIAELAIPILVFVNKKSGGGLGIQLLNEFKSLLNPIQVFEITQGGPMLGLKLFSKLPRVRILACGGDGTAAWVLSCLDALREEEKVLLDNSGSGKKRRKSASSPFLPSLAVLPMGTGNDLARSLGWGGGSSKQDDLSQVIQEVARAHVSVLDRWNVQVSGGRDGVEGEIKRVVMNNYLSFGFDAEVCNRFHHLREADPAKFSSPLGNKTIYAQLGAQAYFKTDPDTLRGVRIECDGQLLDLEGMTSVVVCNIATFGGGSVLWPEGSTEAHPQTRTSLSMPSPMDKRLEVVGIRDSLHMGQIQVGLAEAVKLGQGTEIHIKCSSALSLEVDGEPCAEGQIWNLCITHHNQAFMLSRSVAEEDVVLDAIGGVLEWAETSSVINRQQRVTLLNEMTKTVKTRQLQRHSENR